MNTMKQAPKIILTAALLATMLGACTKKDAGIGGDGDAAHVTNRVEGTGAGAAAGVSGATGNAGNAGLSSTEYSTNNTPRTVDKNESTEKTSMGATGGASGFDGTKPTDASGSTTGTGPASTKPGAGK